MGKPSKAMARQGRAMAVPGGTAIAAADAARPANSRCRRFISKDMGWTPRWSRGELGATLAETSEKENGREGEKRFAERLERQRTVDSTKAHLLVGTRPMPTMSIRSGDVPEL